MKKLLALVLALVMSMSLVTISNAAFKDADKIDYNEAVDVMNAVGVFIGDEKGNFNAKENLTREQAAKIIAYLELGSKAADALVGGATFTDVASTRWSAGFVGYCAQAGVVNGVGNGNFDPAGQLTALQFGKMLLVELGYDAKAAGMVGTDWAINTSKLLATTGLMKGIDGSVNQVLTREKAAQMCLNALKTPTVEYATKGSNITVNGAEINFGASTPTYVRNTVAKDQTISQEQLTNSTDYTVELGEKLYKKLVLKSTEDAFGRPTHTWTFENKKVGEYIEDADLTYTTSVKLGTIYSDLGLSEKIAAKDVVFYRNGNTEANSGTAGKSSTDKINLTEATIAKNNGYKIGDNGVLVQVWYNNDKGTAIVTLIDTYVAKVNSVTKATSSADRFITLDEKTAPTGKMNHKFTTEDFAAKDIVAYTAAMNDEGKYEIQTVKLLEKSASGLLTEWNGTSRDADKGKSENNFTVGGTTYKYSAHDYVVDEDGSASEVWNFSVNKSDLDVYLDDYGYALYISGVEASKDYAVVIGQGNTNQYGSNLFGATLLLPDGTKKEVKAELADKTDASGFMSTSGLFAGANLVNDGQGYLVTYTVEDDVYTLELAGIVWTDSNGDGVMDASPTDSYTATGDCINTYASTYTPAGGTAKAKATFTNGKSEFVLTEDGSSAKTKTFYTTSKTVFFVATDGSNGKLNCNVYTGYANAPSIHSDGITYIAYSLNGEYGAQLDYVYIYAAKMAGVSGVDTYLVKEKNADIITNSDGSYYVLPAVVDGEVTTVKVKASVFDSKTGTTNASAGAVYAIDNVIKNAKTGIITSFDKVSYNDSFKKDDGVVAANGIVIGVDKKSATTIDALKDVATYWAYNDKTSVYYVDEDYEGITKVDVDAIKTDLNDTVIYTIDTDTKKLVDVIVIEKEDTVTSTYDITVPAGMKVYVAGKTSEYVTTSVTEIAAGTAVSVMATDVTKVPTLAGVTATVAYENDTNYGRVKGAARIDFTMPTRDLTAADFGTADAGYAITSVTLAKDASDGSAVKATATVNDKLTANAANITYKYVTETNNGSDWFLANAETDFTSGTTTVYDNASGAAANVAIRVTVNAYIDGTLVATKTSANYNLALDA